jgi:hypothetical protein
MTAVRNSGEEGKYSSAKVSEGASALGANGEIADDPRWAATLLSSIRLAKAR